MFEVFASSPDKSPEKSMIGENGTKFKPKKTQMCPTQLSTKSCSQHKEKKCLFAHNPIELDLIPIETKKNNLTGVIQS